ncbi:MAG: hypothetical protein WKF88_00160 [Ferruginibacter sp.]
MNKQFFRFFFLFMLLAGFGSTAMAQKKKGKAPVRKATTRKNTKTQTRQRM